MNLDIGRSVTYAFEDNKWPEKVGILFVVGLVPGLNAIVWGGYALTVAHNLSRRQTPLPAWSNWSDIAVRGLLSIVAAVLYMLPVIMLFSCFWLAFPLFTPREASGLLSAIQCLAGFFNLTYAIVAGLLLSVGHVRFAQTDQFSSYLELGARIHDFRRMPGLYFTLFFIQVLLGLVAAAAGSVLAVTCIGTVAVLTLASLANGYILGSAASAIPPLP